MTGGGVGAILRVRVPTGTVTFAGDALSITFMTAGRRRVQMDDKPRESVWALRDLRSRRGCIPNKLFRVVRGYNTEARKVRALQRPMGTGYPCTHAWVSWPRAFDEESLSKLTGHLAIGHTRYSTTGSSRIDNAQPMLVNGPWGEVALGHNGNVINAQELRIELEERGVQFKGSSDTEVMAHWLGQAPGATWPERIRYCMNRFQGAYSLVLMTKDKLIGIRDPMGVRPLSLGKLNGGWVIASESSALDHIGSDVIREIEPGEAVIIDETGVTSHQLVGTGLALSLHLRAHLFRSSRQHSGGQAAPFCKAEDGSTAGQRSTRWMLIWLSGCPIRRWRRAWDTPRSRGSRLESALLKNRYVGRTFIQPDQRIRELGVRLKFNAMREVLEGKRIVVVDDSIVRGTTSPPRGQSAEKKRGQGNTHEDMCPAYPTPVLLRCRSCDARGASGGSEYC